MLFMPNGTTSQNNLCSSIFLYLFDILYTYSAANIGTNGDNAKPNVLTSLWASMKCLWLPEFNTTLKISNSNIKIVSNITVRNNLWGCSFLFNFKQACTAILDSNITIKMFICIASIELMWQHTLQQYDAKIILLLLFPAVILVQSINIAFVLFCILYQ